MKINVKRVYEESTTQDCFRILVDRVWPRGMTKEQVNADLWLKEAAPSTELRKWFDHDRAKWDEFKKRYFMELDQKRDVLKKLEHAMEEGPVTLLFSAKDVEYNQAVALREYLLS